MAPFAVDEPSCGEIDQIDIDRNGVDASLEQPEIEVVDRAFVAAGDEHHPGLE